MHDFTFFGAGMMMFWWILLVLLVVVLITTLINKTRDSSPSKQESPMEILKRRYASGEIDKDEFEERKKELLK